MVDKLVLLASLLLLGTLTSFVSGCPYLAGDKKRVRRLGGHGKNTFRHYHRHLHDDDEDCVEEEDEVETVEASLPRYHHGRLLQDDEFFNGTAEEAIEDCKLWLDAIREAQHHVGPKFVRLAFHDCVGGCDGCLNMDNDDNAGLEEPIEELEPLVEFYANQLTRTDIWALSAVHFIDFAREGFGPAFTFDYYGRPTCDSNITLEDDEDADELYLEGADHEMPSSHMVTSQLLDFMDREFNFSPQETVAIMGAHTLGMLHEDNSGFDAPSGWVFNHCRLDNGVFRLLVDDGTTPNPTYVQEEHDGGFLWRRNGDGENRKKKKRKRRRALPEEEEGKQRELDDHTGGSADEDEDEDEDEESDEDEFIMLNVDMALVLDLENELDEDGEADCDIDECPISPLIDHVITYANNITTFIEDFHDVFMKVTLNGIADICTLGRVSGVPTPPECLDAVPITSEEPSAAPGSDTMPTTPSPSAPTEGEIGDGDGDDGDENEGRPCIGWRNCLNYWWN